MHPDFIESFLKMHENYLSNTDNFKPNSLLTLAWTTFWEIRKTKPLDVPISHLDLWAYQQCTNIELTPSEVRIVLSWDGTYYKFAKQYGLL